MRLYPRPASHPSRIAHVFSRSISRLSRTLAITLTVTGVSLTTHARAVELPALGDNSAGLIPLSVEWERGQKALAYFRAAYPQAQDAHFEDYLSKLLGRMVLHSGLPDKPLSLLVIDDASLNAFAAPGGIVGVHVGAFLIAQSEAQLASILAHELAHLSQRHYARQLANAKANAPLTVLGVLGSLAAMATGHVDAGMAGIVTTQAKSASNMLAFGRDLEREADRIGLETLTRSGFDPFEMVAMFEEMLRATRYRTKVPEFLLSHPVT